MTNKFILWLVAVFGICAITSNVVYAQPSKPAASAQQMQATPSDDAQDVAQMSTGLQNTRSPELADYIVAIVQHEPLTHSQVRAHVLSLKQNFQGQEMPPEAYIYDIALKQLILQSAISQRAREYGMRIEPEELKQAIKMLATANGLTVKKLAEKMAENGVPFSTLERTVEQQMLISQLRERTLDSTITVSNAEISEFLSQNASATDPAQQMMNLGQILIEVPENATAKQEAALEAKAQDVYKRLQANPDPNNFIKLAQKYSDEPHKEITGGVMGAKPAGQYPDLFIDAVRGLKQGGVTLPVRSGAGFHILMVLEREQSELITTQTHARHILLTITPEQTEQQAIDLLLDDKHKLETGQVTFEVLAREQSEDGSAKNGGDLGWVVPGMFVPEFERVMNRLKLGEISQPVVTRFGVHLIQVLERREAALTPEQQRQIAHESIHRQKVEQAYEQWARDIESQAYIELREPPL